VWALDLLDAATAILMMQHHGDMAELNPLIRGVFQGFGPVAVVLLKAGLASIVIPTFLYLAHRRRPVLARNCLLVALAFAAIGTLSNLG
jgi:hypothetical protein